MKQSAGSWMLLAILGAATSASASARAGAQASASSSSMLHNTGAAKNTALPRLDVTATVEEPLLTPAGEAATVLVGGEAVPERRTSVGVLGVLGGALCHLVLGTTYCWGNFVPYVPEKLKCFGSAPGCSHASYVLPATFVSQTLSMPLGPYLQEKIGCQATTALGCGIMALGVFLASFAPNLATFMLCYSFLFGSGIGIAYTAPMVNGWRWFPDRKGMVSGAVVAGFGAGGFVFNQVGTSIINPKGLDAISGLYPDEVYANFPAMLRKLALIYVLVAGVGALFIKPLPATLTAVKNAKKEVKAQTPLAFSVRQLIKDRRFWLMWFMALMIGTSGINVANCYKQYGATVSVLQSDQFQSLVGSVAALCNAAGRLFWGNLLDVVGFKPLFASLAVLQGTATAFYTMLSESKAGYLIGTGVQLFCLGGNFAMFPALCSKVFGGQNGAKVYGVLFTAFAAASISGTFLTKSLMSMDWTWDQVFNLMAFLSMCAVAALPMFKI